MLKRKAGKGIAVLAAAVTLFGFTGVAHATTIPVYGKGHYTETYSQSTTSPWQSQHVLEVTTPSGALQTKRGNWAPLYHKSQADRQGLPLKNFYALWR
ncbi:hypothetical protein [Bifidobacterium cuniculi]|uniref:Uncharacterized protein n=1 Tax=Bifidobacterium cuniculi TaxID=1688 RepID=A0A087AT39_9BIFI|nr:hypothetical protein [Bifidobacterium cuniculi]KFI61939.1 hypothetical protein BCUN_1844 [Bifidobacterium cuniculi]